MSNMEMRKLTIDEFLTMSEGELNALFGEEERLITAGLIGGHAPNFDFQGMTIEEVVEKYHLVPMNQVFANMRRRLSEAANRMNK